jgi:hypothetical protein
MRQDPQARGRIFDSSRPGHLGESTRRGWAPVANRLVPSGMGIVLSALRHAGSLVERRPSKPCRGSSILPVRSNLPPSSTLVRMRLFQSREAGSSPAGGANIGEWRSRKRGRL